MLLSGTLFLAASFCFIFSCLCIFSFRSLTPFEAICVGLIFIVCLFTLFQNNLFYILLGFEVLTLLYSVVIASKGAMRIAILYAALNLTAATAMATLIPHNLSFQAYNIDFFHTYPLRGELFVTLLFLHAGGFIMTPVVIHAYPAAGPLLLPFLSVFAPKLSLAVIAKIAIGYSGLLLTLSIFTLLYAFCYILIEKKLPNGMVASGTGSVGLIGVMLCSAGNVYYYISVAAVCQMVFCLISGGLVRSGVDTFSEVGRFNRSSRIISLLFFTAILSILSFPPSFGFFAKALATQNMGFEAQLIISFLSYLFSFMVPLRLFYYLCASRHATDPEIHTTLVEKCGIACICIYFFLPFSPEVYNVHKLLIQASLFVAAGGVYFICLKWTGLLSGFAVWLEKRLFSSLRLFARARKRLVFIFRLAVKYVLSYISVILAALEGSASLSLSFIALLITFFIALFLFTGV